MQIIGHNTKVEFTSMKMISLDSETTGLDLRHGAKPFFVTICREDHSQLFFEWDVDPLTREPRPREGDLEQIEWEVGEADKVVMQNGKFDVAALSSVGFPSGAWPWDKTLDTLMAGHLLASNRPHDLTSMAMQYLGVDVKPFEDRLESACKEARKVARSRFKGGTTVFFNGPSITVRPWAIAKEGVSGMPSAKQGAGGGKGEKDRLWKYDTWLPRALAKELGYGDDHPWWTVLREYANSDSAVTLALWKRQYKLLKQRNLWLIFKERMRLLPVVFRMEEQGVTLSGQSLHDMREEYGEASEEAGQVCVNIAAERGRELELPKATVNNSVRAFCFYNLNLPVVARSESGAPSMDKAARAAWLDLLPQRSPQLAFVRALGDKMEADTALGFIESYRRFMVPLGGGVKNWFKVFPSLNPTGTDTLRFSSNNPNEQQISKKKRYNLRRCFGPAPGREWWSLDAQNIELRIPAFEAQEPLLVDVFLHPERGPYFGSYHLAVAHVLHPELFDRWGVRFKDEFESTWYQWVKNGNFAVIYGAGEATADRTYHVRGAHRMIRDRFPKIAQLNDRQIRLANQQGYVETIPDQEVDPSRGYPILCSRTEDGRVSPTVPLNYHIQGTACWWMGRAMVKCQAQLDQWRNEDGFDGRMVLQVHDEMVFDFPWAGPPAEGETSNLWRIRAMQRLMESCGPPIGVPTPVAVEYNPVCWAEGIKV